MRLHDCIEKILIFSQAYEITIFSSTLLIGTLCNVRGIAVYQSVGHWGQA